MAKWKKKVTERAGGLSDITYTYKLDTGLTQHKLQIVVQTNPEVTPYGPVTASLDGSLVAKSDWTGPYGDVAEFAKITHFATIEEAKVALQAAVTRLAERAALVLAQLLPE